jgi:hypothetical protein
MISLSFRQWLFEAVNLPLLKNQYKKIYKQDNDEDFNSKVNLATEADPTPNKKYINWIFRELLNKRVNLPEDTPILKQQIELFDKSKPALKRAGKKIDIDKYTRPELYQTLDKLEDNRSGRQIADQNKEGAEKLYQDKEWTIVKLTSKDACPYYAKGTKWCTSSPETASQYLSMGPIFTILRNGKAYAQLHIESGQFMDPQDAPIPPSQIPEELKTIVSDVLLNKIDNEKKNKASKLIGIREKVITYPNGFWWGKLPEDENENIEYSLLSPDNKTQLNVITRTYIIVRVDNTKAQEIRKELDRLLHTVDYDEDNFRSKKQAIANENNRYDNYLVDLIAKERLGHHWWGSTWYIGEIKKDEILRLFSLRPDLKPKVVLKTKNGNWIDDKNGFILLNDNFKKVLKLEVKDNVIRYSQWTLYSDKEKKTYSPDIADLILKFSIEHLKEERNRGSDLDFNKDILPEDQQRILAYHPHFVDSIGFAQSKSKTKKDLVEKIKDFDRILSSIEYFDDENLVFDKFDTLTPKKLDRIEPPLVLNLTSANWRSLKKAIEYKINGKYGEHSHIYQTLEQDKLKDQLKILPPKLIDMVSRLGPNKFYNVSMALQSAVAKKIMPKVMEYIYEAIKLNESNEFKVGFKDKDIYFLSPIETVVKEFKTTKSLDNLRKKYKDWRDKIKINADDLINKINNIPRGVDEDTFVNNLKG